MVVQNVVGVVDSVHANQKGMDMVDYQIGVHYNLDELQRTSVGSCVPSVAVRVPYLNYVGVVYGEQHSFVGISLIEVQIYLV